MKRFVCLPCMEGQDELCFISHPMFDRRIQCNIFGAISMVRDWKGWEVWRFQRLDCTDTFLISSWTHKEKVLCANSNGGVYTAAMNEASGEKWKVTKHPETGGLLIQSIQHGRYLAFHGKDLYLINSLADDGGRRTAWCLEPGHRNHFFLSSVSRDLRLSSSTTPRAVFTQRNRKAWEKWVIVPSAEIGLFTIRSLEHQHFLGSDGQGKLHVSDEQETWAIVASPHENGVFLQSTKHNNLRLACDNGGWETWHIEAIMPPTISGPQIWSWVGIGTATIATAVAAPFAVVGVVGALGFGSGGIVGGTFAAGMMSAEAIASGGAIAAGGTVATLQSIGAVGLGAAGMTAAAGAGASVGGAVSAAVAHAVKKAPNSGHTTPMDAGNFPLCSWRHW